MGCSSSAAIERQSQKLDEDIKAATLIQQWYRGHSARMEMKQRYTWSIFQSIENAADQDQLQLSQFFTFLMDYYIHHCADMKTTKYSVFSQLLQPSQGSSDRKALDPMPEVAKVPSSYTGPRIVFPLKASDVSTLLKAFKQGKQLHSWYMLQLLQATKNILKTMPNINQLSTHYSKDITVCGDLHGHLDDLLLIFHKNGYPMPGNLYVFNGDFVDRGESSVEVVVILFAFLLVYPKDVHLNRGNHEDYVMNIRYGFKKEVLRKYRLQGQKVLQAFQDVFRWLPLATIIDSRVLVVHGGISDTTDLGFLASLQRHRFKSLLRMRKTISKAEEACLKQELSKMLGSELPLDDPNYNKSTPGIAASSSSLSMPTLSESQSDQQSLIDDGIFTNYSEHQLTQNDKYSVTGVLDLPFLDDEMATREELEWKQIADILWSDPRSKSGCFPNSSRGGGCYFGEDVTTKLFRKYKLKLLIRSHECKQDGYEMCHHGKVITIFSASNYYEIGSNQGAYVKLGPDLVPRFVKYRVNKSARKLTLKQRVSVAEETALKALRENLFIYQSEIITACRSFDPGNTGGISSSEWASAVESVLHLNLPWRTLQPRLAKIKANGSVDYLSTFRDLQFKQPLSEAQPGLIEAVYRHRADLEIVFGMIDKDHTGLITMEEFQQTWKLFCCHRNIRVDDKSMDDLARSIDFNNDGFIDFNEFLEAFRLVQIDNE
ncbi:serine/threonine-protein phosphatase with EF-hands 1 isoform X1 [Leucoraja erinacea]|uniref:serine/threonine-protein phosphatase with EF-hands 1 isoform X1 n=1 Tax=Leucoraja erinaceus TaxID=7782 RepID=UPI002453D062|nr:serine/threonine-protein phosphatase with EF-hands 1 isoform X1 [Leucoraja erinacea]XP_055500726.1 serine/threonine-protein phosphatase with EF-hands 1 isoform X1 [Leucoraja erinacea]XP_055500727.1 serine/threonine-protein phosphatase with EF-hands 1 isoform X1 [Leucoraja erinacea]